MSLLSCFSWIPYGYRKLISLFLPRWRLADDIVMDTLNKLFIPTGSCPPLPDEVVVEILSRLPAEDVLRGRKVCKNWKALTFTPSFIDLHLKQATKTMVFQFNNHYKEMKLFFFDNWGGFLKKNTESDDENNNFRLSSMLPKESNLPSVLRYSSCGLLLFVPEHTQTLRSFIICNPVTKQKVTLTTEGGDICGIFFHPTTRQYMVLWVCQRPTTCEFKICSLAPRSLWRKITDFPYMPRLKSPPVIFNGVMHWTVFSFPDNSVNCVPRCSESILVFNIVREDFTVKPHPPEICSQSEIKHEHMRIFEIQGQLVLADISISDQAMHLWFLEDYAKWDWVRRHTIILDLDVKRFPLTYEEYTRLFPLGVLDGELLIYWQGRGLFAYHLSRGIMKKCQGEREGMNWKHTYMCIYSKSLVSLKD